MNTHDVHNRILKLRDEISRLRFAYHVDNDPRVTDDVYESLSRELALLESQHPEYRDANSALSRVAGMPLDTFTKVAHSSRMLSLSDVFSLEEVSQWQTRMSKLTGASLNYFCELKLDGLAVSLIYTNGVFTLGATRGDGFIGEDITHNLKMIPTIPLVLTDAPDGVFEVRGEVVMPKRAWKKLNDIQAKQGKQLFANTRNAAAGSLRQLDPSIVKERGLDFFAWDIATPLLEVTTHSAKHALLRSLGFCVAPYEAQAQTLTDIEHFIDTVAEVREKLPYGTDGIVISVDNLNMQEDLGVVGKAPRYMIAYKYPAEKATTQVIDITVNVGRTGVLTPLAHFVPTLVAGSTVSKATLHNIDQIKRLDIRVGDTVVIQKAGDVIPEVVEVLHGLREGKPRVFTMPTHCPVCTAPVEKRTKGQSEETSVAYYCTNTTCPAKNRRALQHFVNVFEIYTLGPKILDRLNDEGLISDAADLFTLDVSDLSGLERFGVKSAENIVSSIRAHMTVPLWRFLYALGIVHVGEQTSRDIARHFGTLDKLIKASREEIAMIDNIGSVVAESVVDFFAKQEQRAFVEKLQSVGILITAESPSQGGVFTGKTFVLTGTLSTLSRDEAKQKIIEQGGKVSSSVGLKTSYVLAGEAPGTKYADAQKFGVPILDEQAFLKLL